MHPAVKVLLAVHITLLLSGCAARPPAQTPGTVATITSATPAATSAKSASTSSPTDKTNSDVDQVLLKRGYRPRQINGQLKYCRSQILTGTHFSNTVCLTQDQIRAMDANTKSDLDLLDRESRAACPNNNCD
jgi:type IV pilus biogenesis protein CpaD/CtpE